jgi:serine/threonine protein kinase/Tfp pilus assembly protein PilF
MQRFVLEAKAASSLNHPNVATIYDIGQADGRNFIAMEYVEGQTLASKIGGRPQDPAKIVDIGLQIADALSEAHAKGITHRDIKPANIMLTPREQVKVLDFGLAKITRAQGAAVNSDIATLAETVPGLVMGTVQYMSPEQVLGHAVDHRSDIFSLGVVLYEMATGRPPFAGTTATDTMGRILHVEPESIRRISEEVPAGLAMIVGNCLEKDAEKRYQSARELLKDLRSLQKDTAATAALGDRRVPQRWNPTYRIAFVVLVAVVLLGVAGFFLLRSGIQGTDRPIESIAVLPFVNGAADPEVEYLVDGITESVISNLSKLSQLKVISRTSAFRYKGRDVDPQVVGRELNVQSVLAGRVLLRGKQLAIGLELIDVSDNRQLWGEQYNRNLTDILQMQTEISQEVSNKLRLRLTGAQQQQLAKRYTDNTEAYLLYQQGRFYWNKFTAAGFAKAIEYFNQAVEKDPSYALAYAGLADSYNVLGTDFVRPREVLPKARAHAEKALQLDATLAEAHVSLGTSKLFYEWDFAGAEKEFLRAIELNPNYPDARHFYGHYLEAMGRVEQAVSETQRGATLDPLSLIINTELGNAHYYARQFDQALEVSRKSIDMDPSFDFAYYTVAQVYWQKGKYAEAIAQLERSQKPSRDAAELGFLGYAYAASGQRDAADKIMRELQMRLQQSWADPYYVALIYYGLNDLEQFFAWLEKSYEERSVWMIWLNVDPLFDRLHMDPRFQRVLRRIGLTQ